MEEQLFIVSLTHRNTGENISLEVWAKHKLDAVKSLKGLIGWDTQYYHGGTCPVFDDRGNAVTRKIPAKSTSRQTQTGGAKEAEI